MAVEVTFLALFLLALAEADARSTAVLVDEFDTGGFKSTLAAVRDVPQALKALASVYEMDTVAAPKLKTMSARGPRARSFG